jgi:hypothetical protein
VKRISDVINELENIKNIVGDVDVVITKNDYKDIDEIFISYLLHSDRNVVVII